MAGRITEIFGYTVENSSEQALSAAANSMCPFIDDVCTKKMQLDGNQIISGACTVKQRNPYAEEVICCPNRLYGENYKMLSDVARIAFDHDYPLASGRSALEVASSSGRPCVAVFGHRWGGELRLPKMDGKSNYFVDWILALVSPSSELVDFCAIEVQTIDTTGNYRDSRRALEPPKREIDWSPMGLNWENVSKRILPQIIYKAQVLSRERWCKKGMFFVLPLPVFLRVMDRLGGRDQVQTVQQLQPSSVTFLAYDFSARSVPEGSPRPLDVGDRLMTMAAEVRDAFNRAKLPDANVYGRAICNALNIDVK